MSWSFRSANTLRSSARIRAIASGPAAVNNSSPILATPNESLTAFASCSAASRSGRSSARASRSRGSVMQASCQVAHTRDIVADTPGTQLVDDAQRGPRFGERCGADSYRVRTGEQHLDGVFARANAARADDRNTRKRARHFVHRAQRDRFDRRPTESPAALAEPRLAR